ncbi:redoxin domain-containing protein [Bradyrhizobium sp. ARR65]|uniref:redoxin domain-containing protein n=1 Tax=Bradyrhizobium sp. ARR65 TaxID=1040989 RepID=UPI000B2818C6|nr:redoxin domain-containing protein [Bradyrhizobium sp. ARR65]
MNKPGLHPWIRLLVSTALCWHLHLAVVPGHAQSRFDGEGHVVAVDESHGTVTLDHGPISGLMPAMRMAFPVQQAEQLLGLQVGALVRFSLQARGLEWVIAAIEPVEDHPQPNLTSFPAPDFTLPTLSGAQVRLSDLRGKVVLLNFWVTWCGSCRAEMPTIDALYRRYNNRGLEVLAINLDAATTSKVQAFVGELGVTFRVGLDPSSSIARTYRVAGLPTTYLIDRVGNVVVQEIGARDWLDAVSRSAIEGLLQIPEPPQEAERSRRD